MALSGVVSKIQQECNKGLMKTCNICHQANVEFELQNQSNYACACSGYVFCPHRSCAECRRLVSAGVQPQHRQVTEWYWPVTSGQIGEVRPNLEAVCLKLTKYNNILREQWENGPWPCGCRSGAFYMVQHGTQMTGLICASNDCNSGVQNG